MSDMHRGVPQQLRKRHALQLEPEPYEDFVDFCLRALKLLILESGWIKRAVCTMDGEIDLGEGIRTIAMVYAPLGAEMACLDANDTRKCINELTAVLLHAANVHDFNGGEIIRWNDQVADSVLDVIELIDVAREEYRYHQGPYRNYGLETTSKVIPHGT